MASQDPTNPDAPANRTDLDKPRKPGTFTRNDPRINKKGRPPGIGARLRELFGNDGDALVDWGVKVMNGEISLESLEKMRDSDGAETLVPVEVKPTFAERIGVWKHLTEHHSGKAPAKVEFKLDDAAQYDLSLLTEEELDTLDRLLEKATPKRARLAAERTIEAQAVAQAATEAVLEAAGEPDPEEPEP